MKKLVFSSLAFFLLSFVLHGQNQFSLKIDTVKTGLLGINKQNRWPLNLNRPMEDPDLKFQEFSERNIDEASYEWNMPVHEPKSEHPTPVHVPDGTINYSIIIVHPESN